MKYPLWFYRAYNLILIFILTAYNIYAYTYRKHCSSNEYLQINESQKELWKQIVIERGKFVYNIHDQTNYNFLFAFFEVHCTMKIEVKHM